MPKTLYILSFLLFNNLLISSCGGVGTEKKVQNEAKSGSLDKKIQRQSAEIEAQEPKTQKIEDVQDLPTIFWGIWTNDGELSKLELQDDGNCKLIQDIPEGEAINLKGTWKSSEKGIKITWEKPYMNQKIIDYRFEQTDNQKLLFRQINDNEEMAFSQDF